MNQTDRPFPDRRNPEPGEPTPIGGYYTQEDMKEIIIKYFPRGGPKFYVSPVWGKIETRELVEYVRKEKLAEVCVQVQLHKIIWEPDRRGV